MLLVTGCAAKTAGDEETAEDYMNSLGYTVTEQMGEIWRYTLEKSILFGDTSSIPYRQMWGVQTEEPDKYFGREIVIYGFTVKDHPLQKRDRNAENGVNVYIMMSEGNVIGGYSYPNADVSGAYSSIDGKTLEEVTGLSYREWCEQWEKKYGGQE
jgi:hypothetical protein